MIRKMTALCFLSVLTACASAAPAPPPALPTAAQSPLSQVAGLDLVMGKTARQLTRLFGSPRADVSEPPARKMQFSSGACILDAYLYPSPDGGESRVTHIDTRRSDGAIVDRVSCVNALRNR